MTDSSLSRRLECKPRTASVLVGAILLLQGCAPVFSEFQSARVLEPGNAEVTAAATIATVAQTTVGLHVASGVFPSLELRARLTHVFRHFEDDGTDDIIQDILDAFDQDFNVINVGPKVSLVENRLALYVPAGAYFNHELDMGGLHVQPALLFTLPGSDYFEMNPSVNAMLPGGLVAVNLGAAIGRLDRWAIRPEVGIVVNNPQIMSFGIAFSIRSAFE